MSSKWKWNREAMMNDVWGDILGNKLPEDKDYPQKLLSVKEVAKRFDCSIATVYRMREKGLIKSLNLHERLIRIPFSEVDRIRRLVNGYIPHSEPYYLRPTMTIAMLEDYTERAARGEPTHNEIELEKYYERKRRRVARLVKKQINSFL